MTKMRITQISAFLLFLLIWQLASGTIVPRFFISSPSAIYLSLQSSIMSGQFFANMGVTALEAFLGFTIGAALGVLAGVALGRSAMLAEFFNPFIVAFYSLPKVVLAPLFILWLGIGLNMKVTLTASIVFFLVFFNTFSGVRNVSQELIAILRLMGASQRQADQGGTALGHYLGFRRPAHLGALCPDRGNRG